MRRWVRGLALGLAGLAALVGVVQCRTPGPSPEGGHAAPCPPSPNCVSSEAPAEDAVHFVAPLRASGPPSDTCRAVFAAVAGVEGAGRGHLLGDRIRFEFHTRLFTDDVDLLCREDRIDVRSASRVGWGDLGVNRARVERIRAAWEGR